LGGRASALQDLSALAEAALEERERAATVKAEPGEIDVWITRVSKTEKAERKLGLSLNPKIGDKAMSVRNLAPSSLEHNPQERKCKCVAVQHGYAVKASDGVLRLQSTGKDLSIRECQVCGSHYFQPRCNWCKKQFATWREVQTHVCEKRTQPKQKNDRTKQ
jgi:hypothetical protein